MPNIKSGSPAADGQNRSMFAKVSVEDGSCVLKEYRSREFSLLANLFLTEGQPGKVLCTVCVCVPDQLFEPSKLEYTHRVTSERNLTILKKSQASGT
jgi:hypothetical protein